MKKSTVAVVSAAIASITTCGIILGIQQLSKRKDTPGKIIIGGSLGDLLAAICGCEVMCDGNCEECEERDDCEFCTDSDTDEESSKNNTKAKKTVVPEQQYSDAQFFE